MEITKENWDMIRMFMDEMYMALSLKQKELLYDNFGVDCIGDILNRCDISDFTENDLNDVRDLNGR